MATFTKFQNFVEDLANGVHDLLGTDDTLKVYLSNDLPVVATDALKSHVVEITNQNGYTAPIDTENSGAESGGVLTVTSVAEIVITATGAVGPFQYVVLYNDTPSSPLDPLIGYWAHTSAVTLADGETFTIDFGASLFTIE